jgi:hypothetical protein
MNTKVTPEAKPVIQPPTAPTLPPVPGGGSWRPNAMGDGWVENLPAESTPTTETNTTNTLE